MSELNIYLAKNDDLEKLLPLVREYHGFEEIKVSDNFRVQALLPLLNEDSTFGKIWIVQKNQTPVGYIAICFGYSIEFCGRDAFIDEFYLKEQYRRKGIGSVVVERIKQEISSFKVLALHLEVSRSNEKAIKFYIKHGFNPRNRYHLMTYRCETKT